MQNDNARVGPEALFIGIRLAPMQTLHTYIAILVLRLNRDYPGRDQDDIADLERGSVSIVHIRCSSGALLPLRHLAH